MPRDILPKTRKQPGREALPSVTGEAAEDGKSKWYGDTRSKLKLCNNDADLNVDILIERSTPLCH